MNPEILVIIPTFNNRKVLERCLDSWERFASDQPVELIVIEDGCKDGTSDYLRSREQTSLGTAITSMGARGRRQSGQVQQPGLQGSPCAALPGLGRRHVP